MGLFADDNDNSYPLINLSDGPPGTNVTREASELVKGVVLITGERKSGHAAFENWIKTKLEEGSQCIVIKSGVASASPETPDAILAAARQIAFERERRHIDSALVTLERTEQKICLIFHQLDTMENFARIAAALKTRQESETFKQNVAVIITATTKRVFDSNAEISALWDGAQRYRLPACGEKQICKIAREELEEDKTNKIYNYTGGQPVLVAALAKALPKHVELGLTVNDRDVQKAQEMILRNPPGVVKIWKEQLLGLLREDPDLRRKLEEYVSGHMLFRTMENEYPPRWPPPLVDLELFVSGWLAKDRDGYWGIRSLLHKTWAREVLVELARDNRRRP